MYRVKNSLKVTTYNNEEYQYYEKKINNLQSKYEQLLKENELMINENEEIKCQLDDILSKK